MKKNKKIKTSLLKSDITAVIAKFAILCGMLYISFNIGSDWKIQGYYESVVGGSSVLDGLGKTIVIFLLLGLLTKGLFVFYDFVVFGKTEADGFEISIVPVFLAVMQLLVLVIGDTNLSERRVYPSYSDGIFTFQSKELSEENNKTISIEYKASYRGEMMPKELYEIHGTIQPIRDSVKDLVKDGDNREKNTKITAKDSEGREWKVLITDVTLVKDLSPVE